MINKRVLCFWILLFLSWSTRVFGGVSLEHVASDEALVANSAFAIIVASIEQVDDQGASNGEPPKVTLLVSEVLRGNMQPGRLRARWLPFPHDIDYGGGDSEERLGKWTARPLSGPKLGLKMILIGRMGNGYLTRAKYADSAEAFLVSARCRFTYSDEKRDWVLAAIKEGEKAERYQQEERVTREAEELRKRREWEERVDHADIASLCKEATDIIIGPFLSRSEMVSAGPSYWQLSFTVSNRLRGAALDSKTRDGKEMVSLEVFHTELKVYDPRTLEGEMLVFIKRREDGELVLVDTEIGIMPATESRIKAVRSALEKK